MSNRKRSPFQKMAVLAGLLVITMVGYLFFNTYTLDNGHLKSKNSSNSAESVPVVFNKTQHSTDEASSLWAVVNKGRVLPASYVPTSLAVPDVPLRLSASADEMHLRSDAAAALEEMAAAAKVDNAQLMLASGYRSYYTQASLFKGYVKTLGQAEAEKTSAHAGHSEHQTGLALDLEPTSRQCEVEVCFESTAEGKWLAANAYKYGFVVRYPKGWESRTGYSYEPWHLRFVGKELAVQLQTASQTLEEFFGLPAYTGYPAESFALK